MAIPNRQIGQSNQERLLYDILKALSAMEKLVYSLKLELLTGKVFVSFPLQGTDGDFVDGERTGTVKDFVLPSDADLTKDIMAFDGLNLTVDFTKDDSTKTVSFTLAPLPNSFIFYQR